jgi:hypothetical protein
VGRKGLIMSIEPAIMYIAAMKAEIISLTARRDTARAFTLNINMKLECDLLKGQIEGLEAEIKRITQ